MVCKSQSVDDYVAALPDGVREVFATVRETIAAVVPDAEEAMKYGMPSWRVMGTDLIYAAAWKNHIGLYPVYRGNPEFESVVGPHRDKKDSVKFVYRKTIPFDVIAQIVSVRRKELEAKS